MFKKLCVSLTLATTLIIAPTHCSDKNGVLNAQLDHIKQQIKAIMLELKKITVLSKKAIEYMKNQFGDEYDQRASEIAAVIQTISASEEFNNAINQNTDYYISAMIDKNMHFNDITDFQNDSINQKIQDELIKAFPSLDQQTEQLFTILYVTIANSLGSKLLIAKLTEQEESIKTALQQDSTWHIIAS